MTIATDSQQIITINTSFMITTLSANQITTNKAKLNGRITLTNPITICFHQKYLVFKEATQ